VSAIKALYEGETTTTKSRQGESKEFGVKVGVHQGSVVSQLLFFVALEASKGFKKTLPLELLYANDLALLAESKERLLEKIRRWKAGLEERVLAVNIGKTKVIKCEARKGLKADSGNWQDEEESHISVLNQHRCSRIARGRKGSAT
jgi:hypothetical protein